MQNPENVCMTLKCIKPAFRYTMEIADENNVLDLAFIHLSQRIVTPVRPEEEEEQEAVACLPDATMHDPDAHMEEEEAPVTADAQATPEAPMADAPILCGAVDSEENNEGTRRRPRRVRSSRKKIEEDETKHDQKADEKDDKRKAERWNVTDSDVEN